jgi:hypothetical protein
MELQYRQSQKQVQLIILLLQVEQVEALQAAAGELVDLEQQQVWRLAAVLLTQ